MSNEVGFVYLAVNESMPELVKIGMTMGNVQKRMTELSADTGVPTPFTCPYFCEVQNPAIIEKQLHEHFAYCRENNKREFFRTDWRAVRAALRLLEEKAGMRLSETDNASSSKVGKFTVIKWAKEGNVENLRRALAEGGNSNQKDGQISALMWAAKLGHSDIVKILLEEGADPTWANKNGQSALLAAENGVIVKILLDKGASPSIPDRNGNIPLAYAVQESRADVVEVLLNAGAEPDLKPVYLDNAIKKGDIKIIKMLLDKGADPKPHLDDALRKGHTEIVKMLLDKGAKLKLPKSL